MNVMAEGQLLQNRTGATIWRALGVMAAVLMDACWVAAWLRLIAADQAPPPAGALVVWLAALGMTAYAIGRLSHQLYLKSAVQHAIGSIAFVFALLLSLNVVEGSLHGLDLVGAIARLTQSLAILLPVPDEVVIFLAVVILWRRGSTLAGTPELNWGREGLHFRLGVLLYAIYVATRRDFEGGPIPELLPTFFLASLMGIAVARANGLLHQPGGSRAPMTMRWMAGLTGILALTTILGVGAGFALNSRAAHQVALLAGLALGAGLALLFKWLLPVLMLFNPLIVFLVNWLRQLFSGLGEVMAQVQVNPVIATPTPGAENAAPPAWLQALAAAWPYIQWALVLLGAAVVIYFVTSGRRRSRPDISLDLATDEDLEHGAGVTSRPGLLEDAWSRVGAWIRSAASPPWLAPLVIRRIYAAMLAKASRDGRPRRSDQTPAEFQDVLREIYPSAADSSAEITDAFELVRYGMRPEDSQVVEEGEGGLGAAQAGDAVTRSRVSAPEVGRGLGQLAARNGVISERAGGRRREAYP